MKAGKHGGRHSDASDRRKNGDRRRGKRRAHHRVTIEDYKTDRRGKPRRGDDRKV